MAQTDTNEKRVFSSPHSDIGNRFWGEVGAAGCNRYIGVSCGAFMNEIAGGNGMVVKNKDSIHRRGQQLVHIKLKIKRPSSSGKGTEDLGAKHK